MYFSSLEVWCDNRSIQRGGPPLQETFKIGKTRKNVIQVMKQLLAHTCPYLQLEQ